MITANWCCYFNHHSIFSTKIRTCGIVWPLCHSHLYNCRCPIVICSISSELWICNTCVLSLYVSRVSFSDALFAMGCIMKSHFWRMKNLGHYDVTFDNFRYCNCRQNKLFKCSTVIFLLCIYSKHAIFNVLWKKEIAKKRHLLNLAVWWRGLQHIEVAIIVDLINIKLFLDAEIITSFLVESSMNGIKNCAFCL